MHFTTVLGVRRARSDERVVSRRDLPNLPCGKEKKKKILKRSSIFKGQRSQQLFSAALLSSLSQQLFSAAFLSSPSQQLFSAAFLSSSSQQLFSSPSQQLFSAAFLSSLSQQLFSAALLSYHLAVVRGWWSSMLPFFRRTLSQRFREKKTKKKTKKTKDLATSPGIRVVLETLFFLFFCFFWFSRVFAVSGFIWINPD